MLTNKRSAPLAAIVLLVVATSAHAEPKSLLFYGNSFTGNAGGVHLMVRDIATAAGHETPHIYGRIVSGQTLQYHLATGTSVITSGIPAGDRWDAVVLQEYSTRPTTHPTDGNVPAFRAAAQGLYQAVLDHSPDAQAVLYETWARNPGHHFYPGIWSGAPEMQAQLRENYNSASDLLNTIGTSEVARVGDAFEAGGFDNSLYAGDLYHQNNRGALLAALVLYGTIYDDITTSDIDLTPLMTSYGLDQDDFAFATNLADTVLVPGPGGAGLLAGLGVLAARRRRSRD